MPTDISFSYKIPADKDSGDVWADLIEQFMTRMADHRHDGNDSRDLSLNIAKEQPPLSVGVDYTWADLGNDVFEATIVLPVSADFNDNIRKYYYLDGADYTEFFPSVERDGANLKLRSNEQWSDIKIVYV